LTSNLPETGADNVTRNPNRINLGGCQTSRTAAYGTETAKLHRKQPLKATVSPLRCIHTKSFLLFLGFQANSKNPYFPVISGQDLASQVGEAKKVVDWVYF
jgi:hypothetical protein